MLPHPACFLCENLFILIHIIHTICFNGKNHLTTILLIAHTHRSYEHTLTYYMSHYDIVSVAASNGQIEEREQQ